MLMSPTIKRKKTFRVHISMLYLLHATMFYDYYPRVVYVCYCNFITINWMIITINITWINQNHNLEPNQTKVKNRYKQRTPLDAVYVAQK